MTRHVVLGVVVTTAVVGLATLGLTLYTAQKAPAEAAAIRDFLRAALAADTVELRSRALGEQPVVWALDAARRDSAAISEWSRCGAAVRAAETHDTLIVSLWRGRTTPACSYFTTLTGVFVGPHGARRLIRLSATCPA